MTGTFERSAFLLRVRYLSDSVLISIDVCVLPRYATLTYQEQGQVPGLMDDKLYGVGAMKNVV
ncbi:hypothetical protein RJ53_07225 [Methanocalculus chunghsingensis]|uniref:Uncharacterized protein n=1 Tax=Methanocalculus chunghsingensis TaxID=156457 RepID=A0A8J7W882_9EURY|nr:hypothetical protein [Methanocalculus chunghsingensis]